MTAPRSAAAAAEQTRSLNEALQRAEASIVDCAAEVGACFEESTAGVKRQRTACASVFGEDGQRLSAVLDAAQIEITNAYAPIFDDLIGAFSQAEADLRLTCLDLDKVRRLAVSLAKIAVQSHMLGLQAAVEGAWLDGETGRHFMLAADSIKNLAGLAAEMTDKVDWLAGELSKRLSAFADSLQRSRDQLVLTQDEIGRLIHRFQADVSVSEAQTRAAFLAVLSLGRDIEAHTHLAMQALQFEDVTRQLIGQIRSAVLDTDGYRKRARVVAQRTMDAGELEFF